MEIDAYTVESGSRWRRNSIGESRVPSSRLSSRSSSRSKSPYKKGRGRGSSRGRPPSFEKGKHASVYAAYGVDRKYFFHLYTLKINSLKVYIFILLSLDKKNICFLKL